MVKIKDMMELFALLLLQAYHFTKDKAWVGDAMKFVQVEGQELLLFEHGHQRVGSFHVSMRFCALAEF